MPDHKTIPLRSEIPADYTWNTADLYPTDDAWHTDAQLLRTQIETLGGAGRLDSGADALYDYVTLEQEAGERLSKLLDYAQRKSDEDTRVDTYQAMVGKAMALYVDFLRATAFETPEVLSIPEERLEFLYAQKPELTLYRRYFHNIQRRRAHTLSDAEERLLAAAGDMAQAPDDIFSKLTDADLTFSPAVDDLGCSTPCPTPPTPSSWRARTGLCASRPLRGCMPPTAGMKNTLAAVLSSQVKQLQFFATARKYPSALSASLDANHVPEPVYHTLIRTVRANLDKMHRYVRLRRKLLGVDALHMYDVYAPMVSGGVRGLPLRPGQGSRCSQAMAPLGEEYQSILREALDHRWIDVYENVGKASGRIHVGRHGPPLYPAQLSGRSGQHVHPGP